MNKNNKKTQKKTKLKKIDLLTEFDIHKQYRIIHRDVSVIPQSKWFDTKYEALAELTKLINNEISKKSKNTTDDTIKNAVMRKLNFEIEERTCILQETKNDILGIKTSDDASSKNNSSSMITSGKVPTTVDENGCTTFHFDDNDYYAGDIDMHDKPPSGFSSWDQYAVYQLGRAMSGC